MRKMFVAIPLAAVGVLLAAGGANATVPKAKLKLVCSVPATGFKLAGDGVGVTNPNVVCTVGKTRLTPLKTPGVFKFFWKVAVTDPSGGACQKLSGLSQKPEWIAANPLNGDSVAVPSAKAILTVTARYKGMTAKATGRGVVNNPAARVICNIPTRVIATPGPAAPVCTLSPGSSFNGLVGKSAPVICTGGDGVCTVQPVDAGALQAQQYLTIGPDGFTCTMGTAKYSYWMLSAVQYSRDGVNPVCKGYFDHLTTLRTDDAKSWAPGYFRVVFYVYNSDNQDHYPAAGIWRSQWTRVDGASDPCTDGSLPIPAN